jgi:hypothetical protein
LPQPGPIEPAPTTSAVFPLSRSIDFSVCLMTHYRSRDRAKRNPARPVLQSLQSPRAIDGIASRWRRRA